MGCFVKSIPWISRSTGWILRFTGCFCLKMCPVFCHIVAKNAFCGPLSIRAWHVFACMSGASGFLPFAGSRACGRKYRTLSVKKLAVRPRRSVSASRKNGRPPCRRAGRCVRTGSRWRQRLRARSNFWSASLMQRYHWPSTFTGLNMKPMVLGVVSAESVFSKKRMLYFTSFCPCELNE